MAASSGIGPSAELTEAFSSAIDSGTVRFLKISISNELLVPDASIQSSGTFEQDLAQLNDVLDDDVPAYVLARLDSPASGWLAVSYVPDSAKVREKMLYAATRNSVTRSLGSTHFTDSLFANSKADLTPEAYSKHKLHLAAPKPLSAREQEMADLAAAEKQSGGSAYQGSSVRSNPLGTGVGLKWSEEVEEALRQLARENTSRLLVVTVDPSSETLLLTTSVDCDAANLGSNLPQSEPSYAFFSWSDPSNTPERQIVFIYCCPSSSPVKNRMIYSSGSSSVFQSAKGVVSSIFGSSLASRKVETSDPSELNEAFLKLELGISTGDSSIAPLAPQEAKPFARPKGPGRKR